MSHKDNKNCYFLDSILIFLKSSKTMGPLYSFFIVSIKSEEDREREGQGNREKDKQRQWGSYETKEEERLKEKN